jgi:hypothetical protein
MGTVLVIATIIAEKAICSFHKITYQKNFNSKLNKRLLCNAVPKSTGIIKI